MDEGRELCMSRSNSELGVYERRLGSLLCLEMPSKLLCGVSMTAICVDVMEDRRELTLLERLDETETRFERCLYPPLPRLNAVLFCADDAGMVERFGAVFDEGTEIEAFRLPFRSSLNHIRKVCRILLRFRDACGCFSSLMLAPLPEAGVLDGVGVTSKVELRAMGITQGEALPRSVGAVRSSSGVAGRGVSLTGRNGGDFVRRAGPLLDSSDEEPRSFSFSSFSSTVSFDFFRTRPAASSAAVVARWTMLTLPDLGLPLLRPFDP